MNSWVIGIGAMKCASTWVYEVLKAHPDICMSEIKETRYFTENYNRGEQWYFSHFRHCSPKAFRGEFSVAYIYDDDAVERIRSFAPEAKLIVCIRNPIDRALSHYKHLVRGGRIAAQVTFMDAFARTPTLVTHGLYAHHLEKFFAHFPRQSIVIVSAEEIAEDPEKMARYIYRRIGVSAERPPKVAAKRVHAGIMPRIVWMEVARANLHRRLTEMGYGRLVRWIKATRLPDLYRRLNARGNTKASISSFDRREIAKHFTRDVEKLRVLTGATYPLWKDFR